MFAETVVITRHTPALKLLLSATSRDTSILTSTLNFNITLANILTEQSHVLLSLRYSNKIY